MCANRSMPSCLLALLNVIFLFHCLQKRQFELILSSLIVFLYVNADRILSKMGEGWFAYPPLSLFGMLSLKWILQRKTLSPTLVKLFTQYLPFWTFYRDFWASFGMLGLGKPRISSYQDCAFPAEIPGGCYDWNWRASETWEAWFYW